MATDQGKIANMHALGIVSEITNTKIGELGTTTFRPPYTPLTFGAIVGRNVKQFFDIVRRTPIHAWHEKMEQNLKMSDNGKELGIIQIKTKACMNLFNENHGLRETLLEF